eukprot:1917568-Rhodomonas_salina.1
MRWPQARAFLTRTLRLRRQKCCSQPKCCPPNRSVRAAAPPSLRMPLLAHNLFFSSSDAHVPDDAALRLDDADLRLDDADLRLDDADLRLDDADL